MCARAGIPLARLDSGEVSAVGSGTLMQRVVGSPRAWFTEFTKQKTVEAGDSRFEELYLWVRALELGECHDQLGGVATLGARPHDA